MFHGKFFSLEKLREIADSEAEAVIPDDRLD